MKAGAHSSRTEAVVAALREYVRSRHRRKLIDFFGKVPFRPDYNYKVLRHRKRREHVEPIERFPFANSQRIGACETVCHWQLVCQCPTAKARTGRQAARGTQQKDSLS